MRGFQLTIVCHNKHDATLTENDVKKIIPIMGLSLSVATGRTRAFSFNTLKRARRERNTLQAAMSPCYLRAVGCAR